jgi:methionine synthase II (cobalamin-independent)
MPDGETETNWIVQQFDILAAVPQLERGTRTGYSTDRFPCIRLRDGARAEDVTFPALGYARIAAKSFETLSRLKAAGAVREAIRLQVNLPSPMTVTHIIVHEDDAGALAAEYERAMIGEVASVLEAIPHDELTIGWDIPAETVALEGGRAWDRLPFDPSETTVVEDLSRAAAAVPDDVPMGFHVCLGSMGNKHLLIPEDARNQVSLMNRLVTELPRPVDWLHAPVPRDVDPERYLAPYAGLRLPAGTRLYLGLIDIADGLEAIRHRIQAARQLLPAFGVSTVCGIGREFYSREDAIEILGLHTAVADPVAASYRKSGR